LTISSARNFNVGEVEKPVGPAEAEGGGWLAGAAGEGAWLAEAGGEGGAAARPAAAKNTSPVKRVIEVFITMECRTV
jgi:hypothetical protein